MSTIISHNMVMGLPSIIMDAPECRTVINATDITGHLIEVHGDAKSPFILGVRFIGCTIIAENLLAFDRCYFDDTCTIKVKNIVSLKKQTQKIGRKNYA